MLFNKFFVLSAVSFLAAASPLPGGGEGGSANGEQCCKQVTEASSPPAAAIIKLLGIVLQDTNVLVGLNCSPITVVGGSGACSDTRVTCTDNSHGNLISIGCVPVTI